MLHNLRWIDAPALVLGAVIAIMFLRDLIQTLCDRPKPPIKKEGETK
jgi:hypothetical protein